MTVQTDTPCWFRNPRISVRLADGDAVLYNPDTGREKRINATGLIMWQGMDGAARTEDLAALLARQCEVTATDDIHGDVSAFARELLDEGFADACATPAATPMTPDGYPEVEDGPRDVDVSLTGHCNLHCDYCFYADEMAGRRDLSAERWLAFFGELKRLAVRSVTLSGGEVFMRPDLWELIDGVADARMRYSILSNGTLISENTLARLMEKDRRTRLNSIQVSIDGARADVHDRSRGRGSFDKAIQGLRLLKEAGFPVTVRVTVNRYNVDDLDNVARLLLDDIGIDSFSTNDAMPMGSGCDNQKTITLTPRRQIMAMKALARLKKQYHGRVTATAGPLAKWYSYREMEHAKKTGEMSRRWKMGFLTACGCTYNKLSIHHDGSITPCNILARLIMGHIQEDSLTDIWKGHPVLRALKDRRHIPMTDVPGCGDCEWAPFCNGSCPGLAHEMTGDFNRANPHDCYRRFLKDTGGCDFRLEAP